MGNVREGEALARSFLEIETEDAEGKDVPELRFHSDGGEILQVHLPDLAAEDGCLVHDDELFVREEDHVVAPIDVRADNAQENEEEPDDGSADGEPWQRHAHNPENPQNTDENRRGETREQEARQEEKGMESHAEDDGFIGREETPVELLPIGFQCENLHGHSVSESEDGMKETVSERRTVKLSFH